MEDVKRNSVLVVDDEGTNAMTLNHILKSEYTVYVAKNGHDAITTAEKVLPDVILLDILMPDMDGYEVFSMLKSSEKTKEIPVIFITGLSGTEEEKKGLGLGAADYIAKPFIHEIVRLRVKNQINIINHMRVIIEKERAEKNNRARVDLLVRMNHEMLTPMNAIMGMAQLLQMSLSNAPGDLDDAEKHVNGILSSSQYLLRLIYDLLDVSGKQEGSFIITEAVFFRNEMFQNILKRGIGRDAARKQQKLIFNIDTAIPLQLIGDEERLAHVITNLLTNAVKFTPEQGEIQLNASVHEKDEENITLRIEVSDNGPGISQEKQDEIFCLFAQGEEDCMGEQTGIGLGLPISKRIIEMMGGKIWVDSKLGDGSKFTFTCCLKYKN